MVQSLPQKEIVQKIPIPCYDEGVVILHRFYGMVQVFGHRDLEKDILFFYTYLTPARRMDVIGKLQCLRQLVSESEAPFLNASREIVIGCRRPNDFSEHFLTTRHVNRVRHAKSGQEHRIVSQSTTSSEVMRSFPYF